MKKRALGTSKLEVSPLCLGGNVFGWTIDEPTSFQILDAFVAGGGNFIDTADIYSGWVPGNRGGESETIIGNWLVKRGRRDDVIVATKVGGSTGPNQEKGLKKARVLTKVEESLRRLRTDYIDLYQAHVDDEETPLEESLDAFASLVKSGKVRAIGLSNFTGKRLAEAVKVCQKLELPSVATLQPLYNLYDRMDFEANLMPVCREFKISVIPYYALASGFLTGKYRGEDDLKRSPRGGRVTRYLNERGLRILTALDQAAEEYDSTNASVAVAWLAAQPTVAAPIASATSLSQLDQLLASTRLELSPATLRELSVASSVQ